MSPLHGLLRRWLRLPAARCAATARASFVPAADGVRLATTLLRPRLPEGEPVATVLIRSERSAGPRGPAPALARILAEDGHTVVLQQCRGRGDSEGRFAPFAHEAADGRDTVAWIAEQPWFDGRLALAGSGYAAYAAWAALASAPVAPRALLVGCGARDPYTWLRPGGALALTAALGLALETCERETPERRRLDLARAVSFRPVREADRVALRRVAAFRDWVDHPERDAFWERLAAPLPQQPPAALLLARWGDATLGAVLDDFAALAAAARRANAPPPQLAIGPGEGGRRALAGRLRRDGLGAWLRAALAFLDTTLRDGGGAGAPVRVFVRGSERWRDLPGWPPPDGRERVLHLRSAGGANGLGGDGALAEEGPAADEACDTLLCDPDDPVPSPGGGLPSVAGPTPDRRSAQARADVLCYSGEPAAEPLEIVGPVRAQLFVSAETAGTDVAAVLTRVGRDGAALALCDGIRRATLPGDAGSSSPAAIEIELAACAVRLEPGERVRLEVAASSFPRFDRNPGGAARGEPAGGASERTRLRVHHDAGHPSRLLLPVVALDGE